MVVRLLCSPEERGEGAGRLGQVRQGLLDGEEAEGPGGAEGRVAKGQRRAVVPARRDQERERESCAWPTRPG